MTWEQVILDCLELSLQGKGFTAEHIHITQQQAKGADIQTMLVVLLRMTIRSY